MKKGLLFRTGNGIRFPAQGKPPGKIQHRVGTWFAIADERGSATLLGAPDCQISLADARQSEPDIPGGAMMIVFRKPEAQPT